jgi:hypothetical protein
MISGPPPGRASVLFSAWVDWLFEKLSPPTAKQNVQTRPPKLVKSDQDGHANRVSSANRR